MISRKSSNRLSLLALVVWGFASFAQSPIKDLKSEIPRLPGLDPKSAQKAIRMLPGFRAELMAAEPLLASPVAMEWDESGRLLVAEMRGYSEHRDEGLSRIRLLSDTDGDGRFDKATVFADKLMWATGVFPWDGGAFVLDAPDIYYFKDTNGDGIADQKERVFTGLGVSNVQGLANSFRWHPEGRIHVAASSGGGDLKRVDGKGPTIALRGRDFSFDPRTLDIRAETGGAQHGMAFDDWGRKFLCHNSDHAIYAWANDKDFGRNPSFAAPGNKASIAADGPQAEVYRISQIEPWRVVRTRLRVQGHVKGPIEGGGRSAGYFTSATGIMVVRGDQMGEMAGMLVVGDVGSNLIHRKRISWDGAHPVAKRIDNEVEWAASTDTWFRPAQFANGPDGALWAIDVCREVIEHPASIPPEIKTLVDLDSGRDRGRLYRLVPEGFQPRITPNLALAKPKELIPLLGHPNAWHRETASRLLLASKEPLEEDLRRFLVLSKEPQSRYTTLGLLKARGGLGVEEILLGLADTHPRLREVAVQMARGFLNKERVRDKILELVGDEDSGVRLSVAFALGDLDPSLSTVPLGKLLATDGGDLWMQAACLSAGGVDRAGLGSALFASGKFLKDPALIPLVGSLLAEMSRNPSAIAKAGQTFANLSPEIAPAVLIDLATDLSRRNLSLEQWSDKAGPMAAQRVRGILAGARALARDPLADPSIRARSLLLLALDNPEAAKPFLEAGLSPREAPVVRAAAIRGLGRAPGAANAAILIRAWPTLPFADRASIADILLAYSARVKLLLDAVEGGTFSLAELDPVRRGQLEQLKDKGLADRAKKLLEKASGPKRSEVIENYRSALTLAGDPIRGKAVHEKICASCHRMGDKGFEIGPSLYAAANRGAESLLFNILDPNREVNPQYLAFVIVTTEGRILTGMIVAETPTSITLIKQGGEKEILNRSHVEEMRSTGKSLMPEGLEQQMDKQAVADLIAFMLKP